MTAELANEVSQRFNSLMFSHMDAVMVEYGDCLEEQNMADMLEGRLCSILVRKGDTLNLVYVPRLQTQWLFDAYGT